MELAPKEVLKNEDGSSVRVTFEKQGDVWPVVKIIDGGQAASLKFWKGDYDKTKAKWQTQAPVEDAIEREKYIKTAQDLAQQLLPKPSAPLEAKEKPDAEIETQRSTAAKQMEALPWLRGRKQKDTESSEKPQSGTA